MINAEGSGSTKKEAEKQAAFRICQQLMEMNILHADLLATPPTHNTSTTPPPLQVPPSQEDSSSSLPPSASSAAGNLHSSKNLLQEFCQKTLKIIPVYDSGVTESILPQERYSSSVCLKVPSQVKRNFFFCISSYQLCSLTIFV